MTSTIIISFDLDDTLYDNTPVITHAFDALYVYLCKTYPGFEKLHTGLDSFIVSAYESRKHYPKEIDFQRIRHLHIADCLKQAGYEDIDTNGAYQVFLDARQAVTLFDDVLPTLRELARRYRLISISNGNAEPERIGLGNLLSDYVNPHDCGYAKPDPRIYHWACERLGISTNQLIHIGDCLTNDVQAAIDAGATAIWFNPDKKPGYDGPQIGQISEILDTLPQLL